MKIIQHLFKLDTISSGNQFGVYVNKQTVLPKRIEPHAANRRLAQWRVKWLIEHSASHQLLWCIDSFVLRNPPLRQAPKR
jgi:hypothetical protein